MDYGAIADCDETISQYTNRANISGDEILEFIDIVAGRYGFCLSSWVKKLIEKSHMRDDNYAKKFYFCEEIEEKWQRMYKGKINLSKEIVEQIRGERILLRERTGRIFSKIKPDTKIFYSNRKKLVDVLKNEKKLDEVLDYWRRVFKPGSQKIMWCK